MTITILDYGVGNLKSVQKAFEYLGESTLITNDPEDINCATKLVFPGQGACGQAMVYLKSKHLIQPVTQFIRRGRPFLGICLGFQLLFDCSEEDGGQETLGLISGQVKRFSEPNIKVPQMGWNVLNESGDYVYFVHSFYVTGVDSDIVTSTTTYGETTFVSSICQDNMWGMQFHPEKSGDVGLRILADFVKL
jgi:imidazole glycerol-phosphate synthase subunit HisH